MFAPLDCILAQGKLQQSGKFLNSKTLSEVELWTVKNDGNWRFNKARVEKYQMYPLNVVDLSGF